MKDLSREIRAYALKNAIEFGKADTGRILPKLFQHGLEKKDIKEAMPLINRIADSVNKLSKNEREKEFSELGAYVKEREEKEKGLPELPNAIAGRVVTRIPPEPSKYLHIGHALSFLLNYLYAKKYRGSCLLRFDDANPEKVSQEYVDSILDDLENYLEIKADDVKYVSDDMPKFYEYAEKLIKMNKAYMCFCEREKMQDYRHKGIECECRQKSADENIKQWKEFLKGKYKEGKAVLRIKGEMKHLNHVMRDSAIFRLVKEKHFKQKSKYMAWPLYDFYSPIEDSLMGITHILRSNEFEQRVILQDYIKELLHLSKQTIVQYGRFNVIDSTTKGREIREMIESKELLGWDDPRLVTLKALKRRGIKKEVLYELAEQSGLSKHEVNLDFQMIAAMSRKLIDSSTNRYYFVEEPEELEIIGNTGIKEVEIPLHPEKSEKRKIKIKKNIFISSKDFAGNRGKETRLLHLFNITIPASGNTAKFTSLENKDIPKIQWVSSGIGAKILMPDGKWIRGIAEDGIKKLKVDDVIQFERFGFVRYDGKKKEKGKDVYEFWFAHK